MDFLAAHDAPYAVKIRGTPYNIPRFLGPALREWAAEQLQQQRDEATAHLSPDDKARFLMFFRPPPIDVKRQLAEATTGSGSEYVVRRQMKIAGVPPGLVDEIVDHDDPMLVRNLAEELTMLPATAAQVDALAGGEGDNPLTPPPPASGGGESTGPGSAQGSTPSTTLTPTPSVSDVT